MHCNGVLIFYRAAAKGACCEYIQRVFITTGDGKGADSVLTGYVTDDHGCNIFRRIGVVHSHLAMLVTYGQIVHKVEIWFTCSVRLCTGFPLTLTQYRSALTRCR